MLKILQARLQQYVNHELPDVQAGFRKGEEPEIKLPISVGSSKKQDSSKKKTSASALLTMPKPLWTTTNSGKFYSGHRTGKGQFSFQSLRKAMPKNVQTTIQLHSFHMLVR